MLLSPDYLPAMRRRRSSDPMGDTASNLGNAMDELMRHQPSLKQAATKAIITLLEEVMNECMDSEEYILNKTKYNDFLTKGLRHGQGSQVCVLEGELFKVWGSGCSARKCSGAGSVDEQRGRQFG